MLALVFSIGQLLSTALNVMYVLAIVSVIVVLVLDGRNPVKTVSWILVLIFLPVIGLVLYLFFGRDQRRQKIINKRSYSRLLKQPQAEYLSQEAVKYPQEYERLVSLFQNTGEAFPFTGNELDVYTDGASMIDSLIAAISQAQHHIHLEFYIFNDDVVGNRVSKALIERAQAGVEVRVIYDDVGCWHVANSFFDSMRAYGIETRGFLKVRYPLFTSRVNYRNHRKIVVIDGNVGFIGGMNLADRYVDGVSWGIWRDTHLRIRGKAVHGLQTQFLLDWYFVDQTLLTNSRFFPRIGDLGKSVVQIVSSEPVSPWADIMQGLAKAMIGSHKYFYIQTPYFLPNENILFAMQTAALAGVDVRLMVPEHSDAITPHIGTLSYLKDVLEAGVKVYLYKKGFLHSKLMVSDDQLVSIGSTNVDFRSFEHNFEINAFIYDSSLAANMREVFLSDQRDSEQIFLKTWKKRPWPQRLIEGVVRLMAPLL